MKFGDANWIHKAEWRFLMMFVVLLDLVITFTMNPYSGIFRRTMRTDVKKELQLTVYSLLAACFTFYVLKIGILFSREMLLEMYGIYFAAAVVLKEIWKQLVMKGKPRSRLIPLYVVCGEEDRDEVLRNALAEEHSMYRVVGCAGGDGFAQDAISKNAREVLLAVKPGTIAKETYETLMSNGIGIHMDIDRLHRRFFFLLPFVSLLCPDIVAPFLEMPEEDVLVVHDNADMATLPTRCTYCQPSSVRSMLLYTLPADQPYPGSARTAAGILDRTSLVLPDQFREEFLCTRSSRKTPRIKLSVFLSEPSLPPSLFRGNVKNHAH